MSDNSYINSILSGNLTLKYCLKPAESSYFGRVFDKELI